MSLRPQNRCNACGYTWYPRGKNVSLRCPGCGSGDVEVVTIPAAVVLGGLIGLSAVVLIALALPAAAALCVVPLPALPGRHVVRPAEVGIREPE